MQKGLKKKKGKKDVNILAVDIVNQATNDSPPEEEVDPNKDPKAVKAGKLGGLKGGLARAKKLSQKKRREIARKAALARWEKESD